MTLDDGKQNPLDADAESASAGLDEETEGRFERFSIKTTAQVVVEIAEQFLLDGESEDRATFLAWRGAGEEIFAFTKRMLAEGVPHPKLSASTLYILGTLILCFSEMWQEVYDDALITTAAARSLAEKEGIGVEEVIDMLNESRQRQDDQHVPDPAEP